MRNRYLYLCLFSLFCLFSGSSAFSQDTINVQTFTFDSITTRRGVWQFPDNDETYRKVLMYYTLKCDAATTHDNYNCGEWDYLTYTNVWDHTGVYDSTLYYHPNFTLINGVALDSVGITATPTFTSYRKTHITTTYPDTLNVDSWQVETTNAEDDTFFNTTVSNGRRQTIYTAEQLTAAGMVPGSITGMKFNFTSGNGTIDNLLIRIENTTLQSLLPSQLQPINDTVFFNAVEITQSGWHSFPFMNEVEWDGASSLLVDISFENQSPNQGFLIQSAENTNADHTIVSQQPNYCLDFDGISDFVQIEPATFINDNFTIEYWVYKKNNNNWSRVFDFGNGPNVHNMLMSLTTGSNGQQTIAIYNEDSNASFVITEPLPLNEWTHVTVRLTNNRICWVYYNGVQIQYGPLQVPQDIERTTNYIGRSNWSSDTYASMIFDDFRLYNYPRDVADIVADMHTGVVDPLADEGLMLYYDFTPIEENVVTDLSAQHTDGICYGKPNSIVQNGGEQITGFVPYSKQPVVIFENLQSSQQDNLESDVFYATQNAPTEFILFNDENNPTVESDTIMYWIAGYSYTYNPDGSIYDSTYYAADDHLVKEQMPYYGEPFEILDKWEIGRFITPYGINLDLGPDGFTWIYDVTDYAHLLKGEVDINAGNQQELLDIRFQLITGTPPREVVQIDRPWGGRKSRLYKALDGNSCLMDVAIALSPLTKEAKIKTRLTGHGHNSNTGDYPHCCEWKDNTHYLLNHTDTIAAWSIWQATECPENPVYPQGGTWPGEREGWCPGDMVDDIEWELTPYIENQSLNVDYDITDVPADNLGMGNGNYVVSMHLVEYTQTPFLNDAEVYDVINPNDFRYYSRLNPICADPTIVIRNNGSLPLTTLQIHYGVKGGEVQTYHWSGLINPHQKQKITLPVWDDTFWFGDDSNIFSVEVSSPNGNEDQYADNNSYETRYITPDIYDEKIILNLKMNHEAYRYKIAITNIFGDTVYQRHEMANDSIYVDTLSFPNGCYTMMVLDSLNMGLAYWAYPTQGSGYVRFYNEEGSYLKNFDSDFGRSINYSFIIGSLTYIKENNFEAMLDVYPNPVTSFLNVKTESFDGTYTVKLVSAEGRCVFNEHWTLNGLEEKKIDAQHFKPGIYMLLMENKNLRFSRKVVIQH